MEGLDKNKEKSLTFFIISIFFTLTACYFVIIIFLFATLNQRAQLRGDVEAMVRVQNCIQSVKSYVRMKIT